MGSEPGRRLRLELTYDGTDFCGWQFQINGRTVQAVLADALTRINGGRTVTVHGAGRTDSGVHARAQVADARVQTDATDDEILKSLRGLLPADLSVRELRTTDDAFDSRRCAVGKTYCYRIDRTQHGDPLRSRYAWHLYGPLDLERMRRAALRLHGTHDWTGFTAKRCQIEDRVRTLESIEISDPPDELRLTFRGDGFMTYMVRNIVGTLVEIGRGKFEEGRIDVMLTTGDRSLGGATAPARGLILWEVRYP